MRVKGRGNERRGERRRRVRGENKRVRRGAIEIMIRRVLGMSVYVGVKNLRKIEWGNVFK